VKFSRYRSHGWSSPNRGVNLLEGKVEGPRLCALRACWGHRLCQGNRKHLRWTSPWVIPSSRNSLTRTGEAISKDVSSFDVRLSPLPSLLCISTQNLPFYFVILLFGWIDARERVRSILFLLSLHKLYIGVSPPLEWDILHLSALFTVLLKFLYSIHKVPKSLYTKVQEIKLSTKFIRLQPY